MLDLCFAPRHASHLHGVERFLIICKACTKATTVTLCQRAFGTFRMATFRIAIFRIAILHISPPLDLDLYCLRTNLATS